MSSPNNYLLSFIIAAATALTVPGYSAQLDPWLFNVYTIQNIGSSSNPYAVDIEGITGSGGSTNLNNYSINVNNTVPGLPYAVYSGGAVDFVGGGQVNNGGVEAAGSVNAVNSTISGSVSTGGNFTSTNGTVNGNVNAQGTISTNGTTVTGNKNSGTAFTPTQNLATDSAFFKNAATTLNQAPTVTTATVNGGQIVVNPTVGNPTQAAALPTGFTYVQITLSQLQNAYGIQINGGANSNVVFDITDTTSTSQLLKAVTLTFDNSAMTYSNILFDLPNATILSMTGGNYASVLAPNADITFTNGALVGNLVADNLYGTGQVDSGYFIGFSQIPTVGAPEPSTYLMLGSFLLIMCVAYSRKRATEARA